LGCKSDTKPSKDIAIEEQKPSSAKKKTTFDHKYHITTAAIESKLEPTANGGTQYKLDKNTVVKLLNETSDFEDNVTVNKRNYKAPYEKVKVLQTGEETWVFSGALKSIYSGTKDIAKVERFQSFAKLVTELNPEKLESGKKVLDALKENRSDDKSMNDGLFFMSYDFINKLARSSKAHQSLIDNYQWTLDDYNEIMTRTMDVAYHPVGKVLHESGLTLDGALGEIIVTSDINVIDEMLEGKVSEPIKEYIDILKLSVKSKVFDNDNIVVPLTSVVNQANLWTQFGVDYPGFAHAAHVSMKGHRLMEGLLNGTKSTPAFDHATREAKPEFREIWTYVLKHYGDTPMGTQVKSHTQWLEGRNWKFPLEKHVH